MFDFIELPMAEMPQKKEENPSSLEGTVYVMPKTYAKNASASSPVGSSSSVHPQHAAGATKTPMIIGIVVLVLLIAAGGGYYWYTTQQGTPAPVAQSQTTQPSAADTNTPQTTAPTLGAQEQPGTSGNVQQPQTTTQPTAVVENSQYPASADADSDGLTDTEERLMGTDPAKPDTDGDSFIDGAEVQNLYDPTKPTPAKLDLSSFTQVFKNPTFKYSLQYPTSWVAKYTDKDNKEAIFTSATGEYITVSVIDNPGKLNALDWYTTVKVPGADSSRLSSQDYTTWSGILTPDGMTAYLVAQDDKKAVMSPFIIELKYNIGAQKELNFETLFHMMIKSFEFTDRVFAGQ